MKTIVYDKVAWHIDGGESREVVLSHFRFFLNWLSQNGLLSDEGKELEELGVDESLSFHSRMLTERGNTFMSKYYDRFIGAQQECKTRLDELLRDLMEK